MQLSATTAQRSLRKLRDPKKAAFFPHFFKTGPGEYGEGDKFLGVTVPQIRSVVREFCQMPLPEIALLLKSSWHEDRLLALLILVDQSRKADPATRKKLLGFYLKNLQSVNNWDLVDSSAPDLLGKVILETGDSSVMYRLAHSKKLWSERVAMVATLACIRENQLEHTFTLAEQFLPHKHDLMHKAVGWMLREAGKRDEKALRKFLHVHVLNMPRTMLRYAIERLAEPVRLSYLQKK